MKMSCVAKPNFSRPIEKKKKEKDMAFPSCIFFSWICLHIYKRKTYCPDMIKDKSFIHF